MKKLFAALAPSILAVAIVALGCSSDDNGDESQSDAANGVDSNVGDTHVTDAPKDTPKDTTPGDSAKDTSTPPDTTPEATADSSDGSTDTPVDTAVDSPTETAVDSALDTTPDASVDTADVLPDVVADAACPPGEWRDVTTGACNSCADSTIFISCSDLDFGASRWDDATSTLHVALRAGVAQIVSATFSYADYTAGGAVTATSPAIVSGNDMGAVLALDPTTTSANVGSIDIVEACGGDTVVATDINLVPKTGGGYTASFDCAL